ncbi:MAG: hypothetical protein PHT12_02725, partial [Patescibacteria group bacterium]|nr:hypothetical protein [Patescibacteria group bacterium]
MTLISAGLVLMTAAPVLANGLDVTPPAAVNNLTLYNPTSSSLDLMWRAPGDDGSVGTAALYDIRYSTTPFSTAADFDNATQVSGEPTPSVADTMETMTVSGLAADTHYYFAMKTQDEVPNTSAISTLPSLWTNPLTDVIAPAAVTTLALSGATASTIALTWTAPGDDGISGTAALYDIRYSTAPILTDGDFTAAAQVLGEPAPTEGGTVQTKTVTGLAANTLYYFAMKTQDEVPNTSAVSNLPSLSTLAAADVTPPAAVSNLALSGATASTIELAWTAPGDDGASGTAALYDIRYSTAPILTDGDFTAAAEVLGDPFPAVAGTSQTMTAIGLAANTTYYFAMKTRDEVPNISAVSNLPSLSTLATADITAPAAVSNLTPSGATTSTIALTWTAPGDDGASGTAALYDIRYSTAPIVTPAEFSAASLVSGEPAPAVAGTVQTMTATGLAANTLYYFAMKTQDEAPNISALSNLTSLATVAVSDITPPAAVNNMTLSAPTTSSLFISWVAPGDDGASGTAALYDIRYSTAPITTPAEFTAAAQVLGEPAPAVAGTSQTMAATGLSANTHYYFAMKTQDEVPNISAISTLPSLSTLATADIIAPAAVTTLATLAATASSIDLTWTAPGDDGASGTAAP